MKKILFLTVLLFSFIRFAHADERILSFHSDITVREDATMNVRETIVVRTEGDQIKHGIYRDFPTEYKGKYGTRKTVGFHVEEILRDGKPDGSHYEGLSNGERLYIGEKDVELDPGVYTYTLSYTTDHQLGFFDSHDELYWNITGNGWKFPIDKVTATVTLPKTVNSDSIKVEGYTGPQGAKGQDYKASVDLRGRANFESTVSLASEEGMTLVVSWPKGFVHAPTQEEEIRHALSDNLSLIVGGVGFLLVLVFYLVVWFLVGRDPAKGTIIPLYEAPDGLSPAAVRFIRKMGYDDKAFAAALIDMAVKKCIRIEEKSGYTIERLDGVKQGPLTSDELKVLSELLDDRKKLEIKQSNHATIAAAIQALKGALVNAYEKSYFITNSRYFVSGLLLTLGVSVVTVFSLSGSAKIGAIFMSIWLSGWSVGVFFLLRQVKSRWLQVLGDRGLQKGVDVFGALFISAFALPFVAGEVFGIVSFVSLSSPFVAGTVLGTVGLNIVFHHLLKAPTLAGRKVLDKIEGLRMYLSVAEKDRLNAMTPPKKTLEAFEKFLPYALALDVEQEWSEQFAEVLAAKSAEEAGYNPTWYVVAGGFAAHSFASSIGSSLSSAVSSSSVAPGSSSGGGGGGSSGGGGGGGGGGGW